MSALEKAKKLKEERRKEDEAKAKVWQEAREVRNKEMKRMYAFAKKVIKEFDSQHYKFEEHNPEFDIPNRRLVLGNIITCYVDNHTSTYRCADDAPEETSTDTVYFLRVGNDREEIISQDNTLEDRIANFMSRYV
jgi:hypothetical protein